MAIVSLMTAVTMGAAEIDLTSKISHATCTAAGCEQVWTLSKTGGDSGTLQYDNWSGRGSKDGSNMTNPFLEVHSGWGALSDATLMHNRVTDVPAGQYRIEGFARVYNEYDTSLTDLSGCTFVAGSSQMELFTQTALNHYNGQPFEYQHFSLEFEVGTDGQFDFGFVIKNANFSWIAFKNFTLSRINISDEEAEASLSYVDKIMLLLQGKRTDATFMIVNPNMDEDEGWTDGTLGGRSSNRCIEKWNSNFDSHQTINKLPNGTYKLTCQGFYRYNTMTSNGWWSESKNTNVNSALGGSYAYLYGNNAQKALMKIEDERDNVVSYSGGDGDNLPFSMDQCSDNFSAGLYADNEVLVTVTDHTLTLGVRKTEQQGCDWTVWDNFHLTLVSLGDNSGFDPSKVGFDPESASWEHPANATSLIENPNYDDGKTGWHGSYKVAGAWSNQNAESWYSNFDVYQTIDGVPNGYYRLKAQGFYRYGDFSYEQEYSYDYSNQECVNNRVYAMYTIPYAVISRKEGFEHIYAQLYANDYMTPFPSMFDYAHEQPTYSDEKETELGYVVRSQSAASEAFNAGDYKMELVFPVTDGTIKLGVRKDGGYKNDWAVWDNFQLEYLGTDSLVYVDEVFTLVGSLGLTPGQEWSLVSGVTPDNASNKDVVWSSDNTSVATVSGNKVKAVGNGTATLTARAKGSKNQGVTDTMVIKVTSGSANASNMIINEIQVANVDMFVDPSSNYGGYVEIYNPTDLGYSLKGLKISVDGGQTLHTISGGYVPANGHGLIWFDHHDAKSTQIDAKLSMDGGVVTIYNSNGSELASQTYPAAVSRTSYARTKDGGSTWGITAFPSPGQTNKYSHYVDANNYSRLDEPEVSHESQLFDTPFTLKVTIPDGAQLHYTTDGSTPTYVNGSTSYDGVFSIDKTTILRLRLYQDDVLPSAVKTLSYIYNDKDYMLPILSVVSDPDNFYSDSLGVLVPGTASIYNGNGLNYHCNWNMEWERPVAFNYFTLDGKVNHSQEADMERCGGWSRSWYPFSYKLKASSQYEGKSFIDQPIFGDKPYLKEKVWQVRNGGNDLLGRIKDAALVHMLTSCGFYVDCQDYKSVHNFINGRYQGMLNIREANNKHYGYANYGYDTDLMDAGELGGGYTAKAGDSNAWNRLYSLASSFQGDDATLQQIGELLDLDEFINYMAAQLYLGGDDWPGNNCKAFRSQEDGKFHFVFFDVDQALRYDQRSLTRINSNNNQFVTVFRRLVNKSEQMRRRFIDAYSIVAGSVYEPKRVEEMVTKMAEEMEPALALEGLTPWERANNIIRVLASTDRQENMMNGLVLMNDLKLSTYPQRTTLQTNVKGARLQLNGQVVPTDYFDGYVIYPVDITASAPEGYTFAGWKNETGKIVSKNNVYSPSRGEELSLTATFTPITKDQSLLTAIAMPLKVNEVSAGNTVNINEQGKKNDWIELYNNSDVDIDVAGLFVSDDVNEPLKYQIPSSTGLTNTIIPARGHLILWADKLESLTQIHTGFKLSNTDGSMVILTSSDQFVANNPAYFNQHPGMKNFVDGMTYTQHSGEESVGRYPDAGGSFYLMKRPTIERANMLLASDEKVGDDVNLMPSYNDIFQVDLAQGWNWISHNLDQSIVFGQMPVAATRVQSAKKEAVKGATNVWSGTLSNMDAGKMYKVLTKAATTMSIEGDACDSATPLTLNVGWNWLGYPVSGAQTLSAALRTFKPEEGDMIVSQDGFSVFTAEGAAEGRWIGTLSSFETGKGYMYYSVSGGYMTFSAPQVNVRFSRALAPRAKEARFGYDKNAYANVMGVVAQLKMDGTLVTDDRFDLVVYADDECRGAAKWVDDQLFINTYGQGGEMLRFKAIDNVTGTEYLAEETLTFSSGVEGEVANPVVLNITQGSSTDIGDMSFNQGAGAVVGYYSLSGVLLGRRTTNLPAGVYIVKYADGSHKKTSIRE